MKLFGSLLTLLIAFPVFAETSPSINNFKYRTYCPKADKTIKMDHIPDFLQDNNINLVTEVAPEYLAQFLHEYKKFPANLRTKMIDAGAVINLIQGNGVTDDPNWGSAKKTFDGRSWTQVPGSGGIPWMNSSAPTRIVANHLYDRHGSSNLFLHEHGHSLDSLKKGKAISGTAAWKKIAAAEDTKKFLKVICGSYCTDNTNEGFAELFAYYYACSTTKADIKTYLPEVSKFFNALPETL